MREPEVRYCSKRELVLDEYKRRSAVEADFATLIDKPTLIYDTEEELVKIVYLELTDDCSALVAALNRIQYKTDSRTSGMMSVSRVVGYQPRNAVRKDYCAASALAREDEAAHALVMSYAERVGRYYEQFNPELYADHQKQVEQVLPDYKVGRSVFTSGIINKDNPLPYHHDAGNFRGVWSNMLVFKHRIQGGYLSVPEYDVGFELKNNSLLMFDGQSLLHGVTPIRRKSPNSHRYSIVFYSLQQMWKCLPPEEEMKRYRKVRTEREYKRASEAKKVKR